MSGFQSQGLGTSLSSGQCPAPIPLGLEDGIIRDYQITASRSSGGYLTGPNARLNGPHAWQCLDCDDSDWIQVDLLTCTIVTGVIMQGRSGSQWSEYVSGYSVEYKMNAADPFVYIQDSEGTNVVR